MEQQGDQQVVISNKVFSDSFLDGKNLYLHCFKSLPDIHYINRVNGEKLFALCRELLGSEIRRVYQYQWFHPGKKQFAFDRVLVELNSRFLIEIDEHYCEILHDGSQPAWVEKITALALRCKQRQRRAPREINLILQSGSRLELKPMEIKRTKLDIDLWYEDDFKPVDALIRKRLARKNDKGIVLLHGLPGTGKTTYLRYLVGSIRKRVLFISPTVAENLMDPGFVEILVNNPGSVVIIEDAENILMDRKYRSGSAVSSLLNISDGLLADFLNVQLVCTFNNSLTLVDNALLRKGRLIARYDFGKLGVAKAQRLSDHLGFRQVIDRPMILAEVAHPFEKQQQTDRMEISGFRRQPAVQLQ